MLKAIVWEIVLYLAPIILEVSRDMVNTAIEAVKKAEETDMSGEEKKNSVIEALINYAGSNQDLPKKILNRLIEFAVGYINK